MPANLPNRTQSATRPGRARRVFLKATSSLIASIATSAGVPAYAASEPATLVIGDQAGLLRSLVEASGVLKGRDFPFRWANFQGAAPLFEAQHANAVDVAWGGDLPVLAASVGDSSFKIITTMGGSPSSIGLLVHAGSPIRTIADLKGRTVVVSSARGSVAQYQLYGALAAAGLKPSDVQVRFVMPTDASAAFEARSIEAWAVFDPYYGVAQQRGARTLKDGTGINSGLFFVTASGEAAKDPQKRIAIASLLARLREAGAWARSHPDEYAQVYARITRIPPEAAQTIVNRYFTNIRPLTDDDIAKLQNVADTANRDAILPKRVDVRSIADQGLARP